GEHGLDSAGPHRASAEGPSLNDAKAVDPLHPRVGARNTTPILNTPPQSVLPGQQDEVPQTTLLPQRDSQLRDPPQDEAERQRRPSPPGSAPTEGEGEGEDGWELPEVNTPRLQPMQAPLVGMQPLDLLEGADDHVLPGDPRVGVDLAERGVSAAADMEPALSLASGISAVPVVVT
ncbi:hypothetical protein Vafri_9746, partial [Volvox africanus]